MIRITKEGMNSLSKLNDSPEGCDGFFHIYREDAGCVACRDALRATPGKPEPGDTVIEQDGFTFSIKPVLYEAARDIFIDGTGMIPMLTTRGSVDKRDIGW